MKRILLSTCILGLVSCGTYQISDIKGVERVKITQAKYVKPQFYIKKYKPTKNSRKIASVDGRKFSNKRAYFLSLWKQYQEFEVITAEKAPINSCPQFHDDLITHGKDLKSSGVISKNLDFKDVILNSQNIYSYPVLSLPYKDTDTYQYLSMKNKWGESKEIVSSALKNHKKTMKKEIETMCEYGESQDYYIYENMISYYKNNDKFIYSYDSLPAVLKIPVISNIFLLQSLNAGIDEVSVFENNLLSKMNIPWFKNYLDVVSLERNNKVKRFVLKD